jgi:hypothetical protein
MMTKTITVLTHQPSRNEQAQVAVTFIAADEDTGRVDRAVVLRYGDFIDLGSPEQITVTVEPGDMLNVDTR